jgi:hypothetical protein
METQTNTAGTGTAPVTATTAPAAPGHLLETNAPAQVVPDTVPTSAEIAAGQTANAQAEADRPGWLPEKFKSPEDLAKSYTELEKKISGKVPEKYDYSMVKEFGLEDMPAELDAEVSTAFKKAGFSQDQVKAALALYADQMQRIQGQLSNAPQVDLSAERQSLEKTWGQETNTRLDSVRKFATTLPERVLTKPLIDTAEGIQFLEQLMSNNRPPNPITNTQAAPTRDAISVREEIRSFRVDEKMKLPPGDPVGEAHRQNLYNLYEQLDRLEKSR